MLDKCMALIVVNTISFPESSFPLTSGRKRELWEQPFQTCATDADCAVKPDGQNSVISFLFKMVAPRALVFRPLVKGNEDSGNEIVVNTISSWYMVLEEIVENRL